MEVEQVSHMNDGLGETSYAKNSSFQRATSSIAKPILEESVKDIYCSLFPERLRIADLGCSSGPNSLAVVSDILDTVDSACLRLNKKLPIFEVFLNDLPGNDFNTVFQSLPSFYERLKNVKEPDFGPCFIAAMPGSFFGRLFPENSIHIIHSSYSIQWLRQAYIDEFQHGFAQFLRFRSQEIVARGGMVLTLIGRIEHPKNIVELLGRALYDMVQEDIVEEEKLDHFNLPFFLPSVSEVMKVIDKEGSFSLKKLHVFKTDVDAGFNESSSGHNKCNEKQKRGQYVSDYIRAVMEPILMKTFGEAIMVSLF